MVAHPRHAGRCAGVGDGIVDFLDREPGTVALHHPAQIIPGTFARLRQLRFMPEHVSAQLDARRPCEAMTPLPYPDARELSRIAQRGETAIGENGGQVQLALDAIGPGDAQRYWPGRVDGNDRRQLAGRLRFRRVLWVIRPGANPVPRSDEPTSEHQSLMRISYAVFCF